MDDFTPWSERRLADASDEQLVARVRDARGRGDAAAAGDAYEHLCHRHERRVRALLYKVPRERVDDVAQDVFIAAFEGVIGDRPIANFKAWLSQIVRHTVADLWRGREGRQIELDREAGRRDPDLPAEVGTDGGYGAWEARQVVDGVLASLSDPHRAIIELYVLDGHDAAETARRTGESPDNVYQVARRFKVELRRQLDNEGSPS